MRAITDRFPELNLVAGAAKHSAPLKTTGNYLLLNLKPFCDGNIRLKLLCRAKMHWGGGGKCLRSSSQRDHTGFTMVMAEPKAEPQEVTAQH